MPFFDTRLERMVHMLSFLCGATDRDGATTVERLVEKYGVPKNAIRKDLNTLASFGVYRDKQGRVMMAKYWSKKVRSWFLTCGSCKGIVEDVL